MITRDRLLPAVHPAVRAAVAALEAGRPVLLYDADGREEETDIVLPAQAATPGEVRRLRMDAGGLVCTAIAPEHHQALGLPFAADLLQGAAGTHPVLAELAPTDIPYDARSSFGITLNHRDTYTGVTDADRALTMRELATFLAQVPAMDPEAAQIELGRRFRSPGHCILLNGASGGLQERQGHTELSLALARLAGITPVMTLCEMMDPASGQALSKKDAWSYADAHGLRFLTGRDVIDACQTTTPTTKPGRPPETTARPLETAIRPRQPPAPTPDPPHQVAQAASPRERTSAGRKRRTARHAPTSVS